MRRGVGEGGEEVVCAKHSMHSTAHPTFMMPRSRSCTSSRLQAMPSRFWMISRPETCRIACRNCLNFGGSKGFPRARRAERGARSGWELGEGGPWRTSQRSWSSAAKECPSHRQHSTAQRSAARHSTAQKPRQLQLAHRHAARVGGLAGAVGDGAALHHPARRIGGGGHVGACGVCRAAQRRARQNMSGQKMSTLLWLCVLYKSHVAPAGLAHLLWGFNAAGSGLRARSISQKLENVRPSAARRAGAASCAASGGAGRSLRDLCNQ